MGIKNLFKKEYIIGLDIGSSSIKLAQFVEKDGRLQLIKAGLKEFNYSPPNKEFPEKDALLTLKDLLKGIDIKKSRFVVSINCPKCELKKVTTPYMPREELRDAISLEAKNYFHFPIDESILDFEILGDVMDGGARRYEVAVAVTPKEYVAKILALLKKVGIAPVSIVPFSYALQKLAANLPAQGTETVCFMDIGKAQTEFVILKARRLVFSRTIPISGDDFTQAMTNTLVSDIGKTQLSFPEAEKIKREVGLPGEGVTKMIDNKISTVQIMSMLRTPAEQMLSEIERCFDYYREEGGGRVERLIVYGGGAALSGLVKFLSDGLGIEVKLGDPIDAVKTESKSVPDRDKISYRMDLAIGAVLGEGKGINILPPEIKKESERMVKRTGYEIAAVVVIFTLISIYTGMKIEITNLQKRINVAQLEMSSLKPQIKEMEMQNAVSSILANEPYWDDVLKELSNLVPSNMQITELDMSNNIITMHGIVNSKEGESDISNFVLTQERGLFSNVKLISTKDVEGQDITAFELQCWTDTK